MDRKQELEAALAKNWIAVYGDYLQSCGDLRAARSSRPEPESKAGARTDLRLVDDARGAFFARLTLRLWRTQYAGYAGAMRVAAIVVCLGACGAPSSNLPRSAVPDQLRLEPQLAHDDGLPTLNISPDGRYVVTASKVAKVWNLETGKVVRTWSTDTGRPAIDARFVGPRAVLVLDDHGSWVIRDVITAEQRRAFSSKTTNRAFLSPDGQRIGVHLSASPRDFEIRDLEGNRLAEIRARAPVESWAFSPDGRMFAVTLDDTIQLFDTTSGQPTQTIDAHCPCHDVAFTADGKGLVAHGGSTRTQRKEYLRDEWIWDLSTGNSREMRNDSDLRREYRVMVAEGRMLATNDHEVKLIDVARSRVLRTFAVTPQEQTYGVPVFAISPDGKLLITYSDGEIVTFEFATGRELRRFRAAAGNVASGLAFSADGRKLATTHDVWDLSTLCPEPVGGFHHTAVRFTNGGMVRVEPEIRSGYKDGKVVRLPHLDRTRIVSYDSTDKGGSTVELPADVRLSLPPDASYYEVTTAQAITRHDVRTGNVLWSHGPSGRSIHSTFAGNHATTNRTRAMVYREGDAFGVEVFDLDHSGWRRQHSFSTTSLGRHVWLAPDAANVLLAVDEKLEVWNVARGVKINDLPVAATVSAAFVAPERAIVVGRDGTIGVWNIVTGSREWTQAHSVFVDDLVISPDGRFAATAARDGVVRLWRVDNGTSLALITARDGKWAVYGDDGTFDASQSGNTLVAAIDGERTYQVDQLVARMNRPDRLLERMGLGDSETIAHLRARHERRLEQGRLDHRYLSATFSAAPRVRIVDAKQTGKSLALTFEVTAFETLRSFQIWANGVPLLGIAGKSVGGTSLHRTEAIELMSGTNRIEVAAVDQSGRESLRASRVVHHVGDGLTDVYFLALGVSHYKNPSYNLRYAHKDALDLANVLSRAQGYRRNHVKVLTDAEVTVAAVRDAKKFLADAAVDDTVIVFVAGHGVHARDRTADYYFATHEVDFEKLATTAAPFELIEALLQDIRPRRKILLLDTCESGGVEPGELGIGSGSTGARGLHSRALVVAKTSTSRPRVLNRNRYIYNDVRRRSGAVVISSSRGNEASYELDEFANGAFTEVLLRTLTESKGSISFRELASRLSWEVPDQTQKLQHPTLERDNPDIDIDIAKTPAARDIVNRR